MVEKTHSTSALEPARRAQIFDIIEYAAIIVSLLSGLCIAAIAEAIVACGSLSGMCETLAIICDCRRSPTSSIDKRVALRSTKVTLVSLEENDIQDMAVMYSSATLCTLSTCALISVVNLY